MRTTNAYWIIPTTTAAYQQFTVTLAGQACLINLYTKTLNIPILEPSTIPISPPKYENINPVFIDLFLTGTLIVGGVVVRANSLIVRDTYLGFYGDLVVIDTSGAMEDPYGVSPRLPPNHLRNWWQQLMPGNQAAPSLAGTIPEMGTRWLLTYWPPGSYIPGYPPFVPSLN